MDLKKLSIGFEFGSTRIKAVVINPDHEIIASSAYDWENRFIDGVWTYSMDEVIVGMQACFSGLLEDFKCKFNTELTTAGSMGISGMMHGYLVLDKDDRLLAPFRTWRNTMTEKAAAELTALFGFSIPQRWSVAHIYQSILNGSPEVNSISYATTLAGYTHYLLTGNKVVGVGEASGIFPVDPETLDYDRTMLDKFDRLVSGKVSWKLENIIPKCLVAGENAGSLTEKGAKLLDPSGTFKPGVTLVPPEGDMGTGMVATNSVRNNTGNASIGTSNNITIITGKKLPPDPRIDIICGPSGNVGALIHVNNGTSDINKWVDLITEAMALGNAEMSKGKLFETLFNLALEADDDCGGLLNYNTAAGETILGINEGRLVQLRTPGANMNLANLMRSNINSIFCAIKMGLNIVKEQGVEINKITGHGGFFKTKRVGAVLLSAAIGAPVVNLSSSSEGGPYGMALLASYAIEKKEKETLEDYLDRAFKDIKGEEYMAGEKEIKAFDRYYEKYVENLPSLKEIIKTYSID